LVARGAEAPRPEVRLKKQEKIKFHTYILYSKSRDLYYIGHTEDMSRRLMEHNKGYCRWTRSGVPWELLYQAEFSSKGEAMKLENRIKKRGAWRYLSDIGFT
jgi:putative endonuclease